MPGDTSLDNSLQQLESSRPVSDADGSLRKAFGVPKSLGLLPGRVTYVIDANGIVRLVFSALLASDRHVQKALEAVEESAPP